MAPVASGSELLVVATPAVDAVSLGAELLVHQRFAAGGAQETGFVPMLVFVGKILKQSAFSDELSESRSVTYLGIDSDGSAAFLASIGEDGLVAGHAVGVVVAQHVALSR